MIIDDDIDISQLNTMKEVEELFETNEDAPQIVKVTDHTLRLNIDDYRKSNLWKPIGDAEDDNQNQEIKEEKDESPMPKVSGSDGGGKKTYDDDYSPPRRTMKGSGSNLTKNKEEGGYSSPVRNNRSSSPSQNRNNRSSSPLRKTNSPPRRSRGNSPSHSRHNRNSSPPRKSKNRHSFESSPLRRTKRESPSPDANNSPPRKPYNKWIDDNSPPRKSRRRSEDNSPPRKCKVKHGIDSSPPRRISSRGSEDNSPPRKTKMRPDIDASPPRRIKRENTSLDTDNSPPRKLKSRWQATDNSPPRRTNDDRMPHSTSEVRNNSPPRKTQKEEETPKPRKLLPGDKKGKYLIPAKRQPEKLATTLDGKTAGLQNASELTKELEAHRAREDLLYKTMSPETLGATAAPIMRDRSTGKVRDLEKEAEQLREKQQKESESREKYTRWGKGLKQVENHNDRLAQDLHEMQKPLARYADDEDLERHLKEQLRDGDPMLAYIKKKRRKENIASGKELGNSNIVK